MEALEEFIPVRIDPIDGKPPVGSLKYRHDFTGDYAEVGRVLSICEASCFKVGIPIMYPTARVLKMRTQFEGSAADYLRLNLVTVSTNALESYCDEMKNLSSSYEGIDLLGLTIPTHRERFSFSYLIVVTGLCILLCLDMSLTFFLISLCAVDFITAYLTLECVTDEARVDSFGKLLSRELMRRHGKGPGMGRRIPIGSAEIEPLSD